MHVAFLVFVYVVVVVVGFICLFVCFFLVVVYFELNCLCYAIIFRSLSPFSVDLVHRYSVYRYIASLKNSNHLPVAPKVFATSKAITPIQQNEDNKK